MRDKLHILVVVKVYVDKVDGTSVTVTDTCHLGQSISLVVVKVCVKKVDGISTMVAGTCHEG